MARKLWIQKAIRKPGALREELGIRDKIPMSLINQRISALQKKTRSRGGPGLSARELRTYRRLILAKRLKTQRFRKKV